MAFTDQKSGVPYAFGEVLTSAHMSYLMNTVTPNAVDGRGGSYTLTSGLTIDNSSFAFTLEDIPAITAYSETRVVSPFVGQDISGGWAISGLFWQNQAGSSGTSVRFPLNEILLNNQTMSGWTVWYQGGTTHANDPVDDGGAITMPTVDLVRVNPATSSSDTLETISDTTVDRGDYETSHAITSTLSGVSAGDKIIDLSTYYYELVVTAELGSDYIAGAFIGGLRITQSVTEIRA